MPDLLAAVSPCFLFSMNESSLMQCWYHCGKRAGRESCFFCQRFKGAKAGTPVAAQVFQTGIEPLFRRAEVFVVCTNNTGNYRIKPPLDFRVLFLFAHDILPFPSTSPGQASLCFIDHTSSSHPLPVITLAIEHGFEVKLAIR